jgi:biopolymer transport protein ExbB/TolQ
MNTLILLTDIVEKIILVILGLLSMWSVSIIIDRYRFFKSHFIFSDYEDLIKSLKSEGNFKLTNKNDHSFYQLAVQNFSQKSALQTDRAYSSFVKENRQNFEKGLSVLATLGANAPFIGLFGTVLGIIRAMAYLGNQSGGASVISGVSQALYATALGLFVAIPAVVAYNVFTNKIKQTLQKIESLKDLYVVKADLK